MLQIIVAFGCGEDGVFALCSSQCVKLKWLQRMYYYEVLCREGMLDCCCLFCFDGTNGDGVAFWEWFKTGLGFLYVRQILLLDMMPALKYVRMLYKKWVGSVLHASLFGNSLSSMSHYVTSKRLRETASEELADHERVLRAVEVINSLHLHVLFRESNEDSVLVLPIRLARRGLNEGIEGNICGLCCLHAIIVCASDLLYLFYFCHVLYDFLCGGCR